MNVMKSSVCQAWQMAPFFIFPFLTCVFVGADGDFVEAEEEHSRLDRQSASSMAYDSKRMRFLVYLLDDSL